MLLEAKSLTTDNDGNAITISTDVTLTEEDAIDYIELDELLRSHPDNENIGDILSDWGFSYSNDILSTIYWDRLSDVLRAVKVELGL